MSESCFPCVSCRTAATDEYHWWHEDEDGSHEIVWHLCDRCCEFAISVVESVSNLEEELATWMRQEFGS